DVGVTEALAPLGVADTLRLIVPPLPTTVRSEERRVGKQCTTLRLLGLAEIVKFGLGAVTVSCTVVVWVTDPSVPVTVSFKAPTAAQPASTFSFALLPS